jgi:DNA modification methylase
MSRAPAKASSTGSDVADLKVAVEYLGPDDLRPDGKNARQHPKRQLDILSKSISAFGFIIPILIDAELQILAGHARHAAAKQLGLKLVPTIRVDHLTPEQRRAFAIADNRLTELACWDDQILVQHLRALSEVDLNFDIEATGFCVPEIDLLIENCTVQVHETDSADRPTTAADRETSHVGDLWKLGRHRVLCADALHDSSHARLMGSSLADLVFTDVPYNVSITRHASTKGKNTFREFPMASGEMSTEEFTQFLSTSMTLLAKYSKPGSVHFQCMDWRHVGEMLAAGKAAYTQLLNICVWTKPNGGMGSMYRSQYEMVFVFKNGSGPHRNNIQLGRFGRNRSNVWAYAAPSAFGKPIGKDDTHGVHPTTKPVALVADALLDASRRNDVVLDPFLGSGSTLIAAEKVGRRCFGLELDPLYVDAIIRRWEAFSGETAVHESGSNFAEVSKQRGALE